MKKLKRLAFAVILSAGLFFAALEPAVCAAAEGTAASENILGDKEYAVVFDGNGADNPDAASVEPLIIRRGKTKTLPRNVFVKTGYTFGGWKNINNNKTYKDKAKVKNIAKGGESVTLQAVWKPNTYYITFSGVNKVTGKMSKQTYKYGADTRLRANKFKCKGYDFLGWSLAKQYSDENPLIEDEALISGLITAQKNNATIRLYAQWQSEVSEDKALDSDSQTEKRDYVINTNTKKFHYPSCSSAKQISDKNRMEYFGTHNEVVGLGYVPCKKCNP